MDFNSNPIRVETSITSKGGSDNANRFRVRDYNPKAEYTDVSMGAGWFSGEVQERKSNLSFDLLREVAKKVAPIGAIIATRIDQVGIFTAQSRYSDKEQGYKVKLRDTKNEPNEEQLKTIEEIERFIGQCGKYKDRKRDSFDKFIRKILRDSLIYDQVNFEIVRDQNGKPLEFHAVDASTIRAASEDYEPGAELSPPDDDEEIEYVQVIDGKIVAWFTAEELAFAVRNPVSDITIQPYGISEIELIVKQVSSYLEAEDYNARFFQQGGMTKGVFNIKQDPSGQFTTDGLQSFKRQWRTQVSGQKGAWKIPVLQLPGELEFINISQTGGEMVFEKWINYLINICCAVYRIDPAEINFPNNGGVGGRGGGIFEGSNDSKYRQSKAKGLFPLLQFVENVINEHIVRDFGDEYKFVFEGQDSKDEAEQVQLNKQKVESYLTVNELRKEKGLPELDGGDIILNPYFAQSTMQSKQGAGDGFNFDLSAYGYGDDEEQVDDAEQIEDQ